MAAKSPEVDQNAAGTEKDKSLGQGKLKLSRQTLSDLEAIVKEAQAARQSKKVCVA